MVGAFFMLGGIRAFIVEMNHSQLDWGVPFSFSDDKLLKKSTFGYN